jgi:SAM-dependent methyltransferase
MIEAIKRRVEREGLTKRVVPWLGETSDPLLPRNTLDAVLILDSYHEFEEPIGLLRNVLASLKPRGRIGIVGFNREGGGPGPPMEVRVDPERVIRDAEAAGLRLIARPNFLRYQYMLVFERPETTASYLLRREPVTSSRPRFAT